MYINIEITAIPRISSSPIPEDKHNTVNKKPDISKAVGILGHNPTVLLENGVPRTIEWMKSIYKV